MKVWPLHGIPVFDVSLVPMISLDIFGSNTGSDVSIGRLIGIGSIIDYLDSRAELFNITYIDTVVDHGSSRHVLDGLDVQSIEGDDLK
jgi:hypothetical protein